MIGTVIANKYRVVSLIGSGGMANVYKAVQIAGSHRTVAVKVLKEEFEGDGEFLRRFQQEAMAVVSLSHENIVRSYDVGVENGHHYIVLEYVEGKTLKDRIKEDGPMSARNAIHIAQQVLDALSHAHESGFIHRDVKPQNVIVTQRGRAKLADFGIVRDATATTVTFAGANVLGSVHYFSPEQAKGRPVTVESDIYSMGIMLYEMVTGKVPYTGETPVTVALKHLQETITPPCEVNSAVPRALNDIILRATNKDPSKRYHSAKGMRQDLMRALKEPEGDFARQNEFQTVRPVSRSKRNMGSILRIGLTLAMVLTLCVALFLVGNTVLQREKAETVELVPTFLDKTLEDAKAQAERRAYVIEVIGTVQTEDKEPGVVISQDPAPGTSLKAGNTVKVVISEGVVMPVVPDLTGSTLAKAEELLAELGLKTGDVEYRISEAPIGTVYQQDPVSGTHVLEGDTVRLFISGEPSETIEVPNVENQPLAEALQLLKQRGFSRFRVRWGEPMELMPEGQVYLQQPAPGESVLETAMVELTAGSTLLPEYSASIAFEMDVERDGTLVTVVVLEEEQGVPYERVVFEETLNAGEGQMLSFTAYSDVSGEHTLIRYVDGEEIRRVNTNFSYAG